MLRVTVRGSGVPTVVLGSGETLAFGRQATGTVGATPEVELHRQAVDLPNAAPHVSRLVGELVVAEDVVRLRWRGTTEGTLSSLFEAPGGARRVTLASGMTALLDEGENQIMVLRGRSAANPGAGSPGFADILLAVSVQQVVDGVAEAYVPAGHPADRDGEVTGPAPALTPHSREWFVALALAEPWLTGADDYPRPPSNREIYERVLGWHGYAWNLARSQRVDDALRVIARLAFGPHDDPFAPADGRAQNVRFAIGRRAAEIRLVTAEELEQVEQAARARPGRG